MILQLTDPPIYPNNCVARRDVLQKVIRSPGHVRDAAIPLYTEIGETNYDKSGIVKFFPLLDLSIKGPPVLKYVVKEENYGSKISECFSDLFIRYGDQIFVKEDEKKKSISNIAVIFSERLGDSVEILKSTVMNNCDNQYISTIIQSSTSCACDTSHMYWGKLNNFSGLERPFIIVVGDIDSLAYSAVTRCTFQLCIVSNLKFDVYDICEADIGEEVSYAQASDRPMSLISESEIVLPLKIDLLHPPSSETLDVVRGVKLEGLTLDFIQTASWFELFRCEKLKILDLSASLESEPSVENRHLVMDALISSVSGCQNLIRLNISRNRLESLSDAICLLSRLEWLDCSNNCLRGIYLIALTNFDARVI